MVRRALPLLLGLLCAGCDDGPEPTAELEALPYKPLRFNMAPTETLNAENSTRRYRVELAGPSTIRLVAAFENPQWVPMITVTDAAGNVVAPAATGVSQRGGNRLEDEYADLGGTYFVDVEPVETAAGTSSITHVRLDCEAGACDITDAERSECLETAIGCAVAELGSGQSGSDAFAACLGVVRTASGKTCADACNHAFFADTDIVGANHTCRFVGARVEFFAEADETCHEAVGDCMDACMDAYADAPDDLAAAPYEDQPFARCWDGGGGVEGVEFYCPDFLPRTTACGGDLDPADPTYCTDACRTRLRHTEPDILAAQCEAECG